MCAYTDVDSNPGSVVYGSWASDPILYLVLLLCTVEVILMVLRESHGMIHVKP